MNYRLLNESIPIEISWIMFVFIPLGGTGQRFKLNGYTPPKAWIPVFGKPILQWVIDSILLSPPKDLQFVYVAYNREYTTIRLEDHLQKLYPNLKFEFFPLMNDTRGAAETMCMALDALDVEDQPFVSIDGDTFYTADLLALWKRDNAVVHFKDDQKNPIYSYVVKDASGHLTDIVEKKKVSDDACSGCYAFSSWKTARKLASNLIARNELQKGEFYMSGVVKALIKQSGEVSGLEVSKKDVICLGTPLQVRMFCHNYPRRSAMTNALTIAPKRYCFDLDNTLVTFPLVPGDYSTCAPIKKNIAKVQHLKAFGHTIIIYTARRMKTHNGDVGKVVADVGALTIATLDKFNIPYDEIYFGKPQADAYVDDLAISAYDDLEKALGYYTSVIPPRHFNTVERTSISLYTKRSVDLSGEIFYYRNIPTIVKDVFPLMIDYGADNTWYSMENIDSLSASTLYTSELMTHDHLRHILGTLNRLHQVTPEDPTDIYANYIPKITGRFTPERYGDMYATGKPVYDKLIGKFESYVSGNRGRAVMIHGDPVLSNILINKHGKIKMIDMRGKLGDTLSIYGDIMYDWAKIYQSLVGYDEILTNNHVSAAYKAGLLRVFQDECEKQLGAKAITDVRLICVSLLFSLIPLHQDSHKKMQYFELCKSLLAKDEASGIFLPPSPKSSPSSKKIGSGKTK